MYLFLFASCIKCPLILSHVCNMYKHIFLIGMHKSLRIHVHTYEQVNDIECLHRLVCTLCVFALRVCGNCEEDKFNGWASSSFTILLSLYLTLLLVSLLFLPFSLHFFLTVGRTFISWRD